jgi:Putative mono-oxygenase ydhR
MGISDSRLAFRIDFFLNTRAGRRFEPRRDRQIFRTFKNASKRVEELPMITAVVRFKLPATIDAAKAAELFQGSAPKYQGLPGLIRKYYLFDAESRTGGGCYLWESREAAERVYNAEWRKMITERYGAPPEISYFETPVVVDNTIGKTILDAAE